MSAPSPQAEVPAHWSAVYSMAFCAFVLVAAEFMPVLAAFAAVMSVIAGGLAIAGSSPTAVLALQALWGFLGTAAQVVRWAWVTQICAEDVEAGGGLLVAVAQVGIASGSFLGGNAYDSHGPIWIALGSCLTLAFAAVVTFSAGRLEDYSRTW